MNLDLEFSESLEKIYSKLCYQNLNFNPKKFSAEILNEISQMQFPRYSNLSLDEQIKQFFKLLEDNKEIIPHTDIENYKMTWKLHYSEKEKRDYFKGSKWEYIVGYDLLTNKLILNFSLNAAKKVLLKVSEECKSPKENKESLEKYAENSRKYKNFLYDKIRYLKYKNIKIIEPCEQTFYILISIDFEQSIKTLENQIREIEKVNIQEYLLDEKYSEIPGFYKITAIEWLKYFFEGIQEITEGLDADYEIEQFKSKLELTIENMKQSSEIYTKAKEKVCCIQEKFEKLRESEADYKKFQTVYSEFLSINKRYALQMENKSDMQIFTLKEFFEALDICLPEENKVSELLDDINNGLKIQKDYFEYLEKLEEKLTSVCATFLNLKNLKENTQ
jgi:hypothetical protein